MEAVFSEKFLGQIFRPVGQQRDPEKIFLAGKLNCMVEQFRTITVSLELLMDDKILQQNNETALRRADGEKQINHADNGAVAS